MSLYDDLGGERVIASAVEGFFARSLADATLAAWAVGLGELRKRVDLGAYLAVALDGPERYTGRSMRAAHAGRGITGPAFDTVLRHLTEALAEAGAPGDAVALVGRRLATLRPVIVERSHP